MTAARTQCTIALVDRTSIFIIGVVLGLLFGVFKEEPRVPPELSASDSVLVESLAREYERAEVNAVGYDLCLSEFEHGVDVLRACVGVLDTLRDLDRSRACACFEPDPVTVLR